MLCGINQRTEGLEPDIRSEGCLFLCFAYISPLIFEGKKGIIALNHIWNKAKEKGIINSSNEVSDHTSLAQEFFALDIIYEGFHREANDEISDEVLYAFGVFHWKYSHFVVLNKSKEVIFDPLIISNSVKFGELKTMRWYYYAD